ncbi:MAG TPA: BON domain-containing protein [Thermoanaerobaculia bacterium]
MNRQQWTLLGGAAGLGAGLMYLLDPGNGGRRRALAKDKCVRAYHVSSDALRKSSRDLGNRSKGLVAGARSKLRKGDDAPDQVLEGRVRSTLGRAVSHPGALLVEVYEGRVILRGDVLASELSHLLSTVQSVKGVSEVDNQLNVHESAEGVSALQNGASRRRRTLTLTPAGRLLAGTAGGVLAAAGLTRRDKLGAALGAAGLGLLATTSGFGVDKAAGLLRRRANDEAQAEAL